MLAVVGAGIFAAGRRATLFVVLLIVGWGIDVSVAAVFSCWLLLVLYFMPPVAVTILVVFLIVCCCWCFIFCLSSMLGFLLHSSYL